MYRGSKRFKSNRNMLFGSGRSSSRNRFLRAGIIIPIIVVLCLLLVAGILLYRAAQNNEVKQTAGVKNDVVVVTPNPVPSPASSPEPIETPPVDEPEDVPFLHETDRTAYLNETFPSEFVFLMNAESGEILVEKNAFSYMNPASMTKVLTLLVAVENISDTDGTFTMTREIADYCFVNECSVVGYIVGEMVPINELFYGCILSSGADACLALAELAAGSHEAFVDLMNEKLLQLELSETAHFTNCTGIYEELHGCTPADMALIMKAALENDICRKIICTKIFESVPTEQHPEGQFLSNWFVRSLEDYDAGSVQILGGKRGYVHQSGNCAVSYGETEDGQSYICVTGNAPSQKQAILDHAALYKEYCN